MLQNFLPKYARWLLRRWKAFLIFSFGLSLASVLISAFYLQSQTGILDLYSPEEPVAKRFIEYVQKFGAAQTLVIVAEGGSAAERRQVLEELEHTLKKEEANLLQEIFYRVDLDFYRKHALQYMDAKKVQELLHQLDQEDSQLKKVLQSKNFADYLQILQQNFDQSPRQTSLSQENTQALEQALKPLEVLAQHLKEPQSLAQLEYQLEGKAAPEEGLDEAGFLSSQNPPFHLMLVKPKDPKQDHRFDRKMIKKLRGHLAQLKKNHPEIKLALTGGPALNYDQFEISERDMRWASIFAFLSTGLLFFLAFQSFWRPFLGLLSLAVSITWTFGLTTLTIGHLNMFSLAFMVILIGQGTYYGVHVVARYEEELKKGKSVNLALEATMVGIFGNISTSTLTTSAAFFATMLVPLKGFAELGFIAGCGILLSSLSMQMLLPCLLKLYDRHGVRFRNKKKFKINLPRWAEKIPILWETLATKRFYVFILIPLVSLSWGAYALWVQGIPFDSNLLNLQAEGTEAVAYEKKLQESDLSPRSAVLLVKEQAQAKKLVEQLEKLSTVKKVSWLGQTLPQAWQGDRQKLSTSLKNIKAPQTQSLSPQELKENLENFESSLNQLSENLLGAPQGYELLPLLEKTISNINVAKNKISPQLTKPIHDFNEAFLKVYQGSLLKAAQAPIAKKADLAPEILSRLEASDGTLAIHVYPAVNIWEKKPLEAFTAQLYSVSPNFTGPPMMFYEILNLVRSSYFLAGLLSAGAIFLLFLLNFRSLKYSLLAMAPLVFGVFSLFGLMELIGLTFNTANLIALPMILGIGADNGVHILQRYRQEGETNVNFLLGSTGKALLLTYLDTLTSFLGIALARHQGLASLGQIVLIGITCSTIMGLIFLPPVLLKMRKTPPQSPLD